MRRLTTLASGPVVAVAWVALALALRPIVLEHVELRFHDLRQRFYGIDRGHIQDIVLVNIDAPTHEVIGWPIPRHEWSALLIGLMAFQPRQIALDLFFTHHLCSAEEDTTLARAMQMCGNVLLGIGLEIPAHRFEPLPREPFPADSLLLRWLDPRPALHGDDRVVHSHYVSDRPLPVLAEAAAAIGNAAVDPDQDGVFRRIPVLTEYGGYAVPSFALAAYLQRQGLALSDCRLSPGRSLEIPGRKPVPLDAMSRMILHYVGGPSTFRTVEFYEFTQQLERAVLDDDPEAVASLAFLRDATVLVGITDPSVMDLPATPVHPRFPGFEIQATALDNLIRARHVRRLGMGWEVVTALLLALAGAFAGLRLRPAAGTAGAVLAAVVFAGVVFWLGGERDIWLGAIMPLVALAGSYGTTVMLERLAREREQRLVKDAFGKYVSPGALKQLLEDPVTVLGRRGEKKQITILFSDVKGFSALCEGHEPDPLLTQLNEYLAEMTEIVFAHGGAVDKFMGDGLMAFFGHPVPMPDHARRAVEAGRHMQRRLEELRGEWQNQGRLDFHIRIGINSGEVIAGSMGGGRKMDYTVFGKSVNLAQRLESGSDVDGVLVSADTLARAGIDPSTAVAKTISAKNIGEVTAYQVSTG
ncbi:adenylate/guanylate cyclase domain-containing protein [Candidatus Fermentibacteria bacterium]|nr:adenylate/guanylate cyclase domain-containing protein [Candidatus Fermentibacteria bacterium]